MTTRERMADVLSDFARTMVTDFPIQEMLNRLVESIVEVLPISAAGVTLIGEGSGPPQYIAASSAAALRYEKLQTAMAEGPCLAAYRTNEAISVPDLASDDRFTRFAPPALEAGLVAVFTFPLRHGEQDAVGALDLYRETPGPLSHADMYAAQTLADVAAAYVLNAQARQDLTDAAERFQISSLHDSLTGLPNRVLFGQLVDHAVLRARRSGKQLAVLFADLDRFKEVNDIYGHHVGDELLVAVAERLTRLLRPDDTLARLGGDEFVILCEGLAEASDVEQLAGRIDAGMNQPFHLTDHTIDVTASLGIAFSGSGDDVPGRLLRDADTAMYQAKRRGGAGHQVLDLREQERTDDMATLSRDLHGVLQRGELHAHYQPVVSAENGHIVGVEALMRWTHPSRGPVPPSLIVPLAEEAHLICAIGRWMFEQACNDRAEWLQADPSNEDLQLAINASPHELLSCDYVAMVESVLSETGTDPRAITIEVTENVLIRDPERALLVLRDLKALGVQLALDDFGTGYSSLSYLQTFPVDVVKVDRSFISKLGDDNASRIIMAAIVDLAHSLSLTVIAEGMETPEEHHEVAGFACEAYQGFYFAKPMPADDIAALLQRATNDGTPRLPDPKEHPKAHQGARSLR